MGILDGIVEWIAEQVMYGLDLINTSVLGALGCNMSTFLRYFPAAETMYHIFVALAIGMILLNLIWQLFKNYGLVAGVEAEDPVKLTIRSVLFILLAYFADEIVELILKIGVVRTARTELCRLQLGHTHHHRRLCQRCGGSNCPDPRPHFGVELYQAAI